MKKNPDIPKLVYKRDIFLLILIVFVVAVILLIRYIPSEVSGKKYAEITVDGSVALKMEINEDTGRSEIPVENGYGTVVVHENGKVWIDSCDCEEQICVHMGKISNVGTSIICLPAKTVVSIVGEAAETESQTDAQTY